MEHQEQHRLVPEIIAFFTKFTWVLYIGVGLLGKIGLMMQGQKKQTLWQIIGNLIGAGFVGYLAAMWCMYKYPCTDKGCSIESAIIVPLATLLSDRVITLLMNINWKEVFQIITGVKGRK